MKRRPRKNHTNSQMPEYPFERVVLSDNSSGLTGEEVNARVESGASNRTPEGITPSVSKIVLKNVCTLFNLINLLLAVALILVGHPENTLFFGIAVCHTALGIIQEIRSKRTLDRLAVLASAPVTVVRDKKRLSIRPEEVVLDDILILRAGDQIPVDGIVTDTKGIEIDESLLTGESVRVPKAAGDRVRSGSYVTSGEAVIRATAVGEYSYANTLTVQARQTKKTKTPLMRTLNNIIRVLTIVIIPIGALLFYNQYTGSGDLRASVLGSAASMIGMIPEGLILLTGVTLTVGAVKLAKKKALVQSLPSIETLARVDVLCLDKTGTITDGSLSFEEMVMTDKMDEQTAGKAVFELMRALTDDNPTARVLRAHFRRGDKEWEALYSVPFSSDRKWSGATFRGEGSFILGAPAFIIDGISNNMQKQIDIYASAGFRVVALAHSKNNLTGMQLPEDITCVALIAMSDTVRPTAIKTFRFFADEGVQLKVISGDDALTASTIAAKAEIPGADSFIDMSQLPEGQDLAIIARENTVFGRVSPQQKQALIKAMKDDGRTVCMTGDGVNDVPALKEADCSVAMLGGSGAARGAADFVLMNSSFASMIDVLREGRRVINNIENVASLYLVKTIYSTILSLLYIFLPYPYPFAPLQMTPMNVLTVGIPSFLLALRGSYTKPEGRFLGNILENSLPAAICVVFDILILQLAGIAFSLPWEETSTMCTFLIGVVGFILLYKVSRPIRVREALLLAALSIAFVAVFLFFGKFFMLESLLTRNAFFYLPLVYISWNLFRFLSGRAETIRQRREEAAEK